MATAGTFDIDSELKIWKSTSTTPLVDQQFKKDKSIFDIQRIFAIMTIK
ncbi:PH domain-containing protein [Virgibacillus pantothenticus]|nr:PH domain-containing protein [Virgibacillus pantothenticus]MBU8567927.1 PH domain-containing protein [Virgibacillus pantothenticus]MBU8601813.1 PH domain-containing protein [Virgibacillus pantothenticus]MBU8635967.1 PH domain-containing protein [Virgibacillus pantothenticus]MBU8643651.1 PH domain-containing protein [Virgibacillus pantothenticus]MBU8647791.1 PH domain-containing protein [Virgibacillus pantothenticus]